MSSAGTVQRPVFRSSRWAISAIVAGHVVGSGWFMVDAGRHNLGAVVIATAMVALAGAGVATAAAATVWFEPVRGWRGVVPVRPGYVALGAAVAVLLPLAWGTPALMFSLPWGIGIAVAGWLCGRAAVAAGWTVVVSAAGCAAFALVTHLATYGSTTPAGD